MTFDQAALTAARAVADSPLNMTIETYHRRIPSLVVKTGEEGYLPMTVQEWRESGDRPLVILTMASGDAFGG